jgi:hypothetical protein
LLLPVAAVLPVTGHSASPAQTTFVFTNRETTYARISTMYEISNQCVAPGQSRTWTLQPNVQYHVLVDAASDAACARLIAGSHVQLDASAVNGALRATYSRRFALDQPRPLPPEAYSLNLNACGVLRTINLTQNRVWVTVYDLAQTTHLDYGWVEACSIRDWRAGRYWCGSYFHARAEVKNSDLSGNIYDTRVQVNVGSSNGNIVTLRHGQGNYYWDHGYPHSLDQTPNGDLVPGGCETPQAASSPEKSVTLHFTNQQATPVRVHATFAMYGGDSLDNQCIGPKQTRDFKMYWDARYGITAEAAVDANCAQVQGGANTVSTMTAFGTRAAETIDITYSYRYALDPS